MTQARVGEIMRGLNDIIREDDELLTLVNVALNLLTVSIENLDSPEMQANVAAQCVEALASVVPGMSISDEVIH